MVRSPEIDGTATRTNQKAFSKFLWSTKYAPPENDHGLGIYLGLGKQVRLRAHVHEIAYFVAIAFWD